MIYHIASINEWEQREGYDDYAPSRFAQDGFIHCSTDKQVQRIANSLFKDHDEVWLLFIDEAAESSFIKHENLEGGTELFPHIYRELSKSSIVKKMKWKRSSQGFVFPS